MPSVGELSENILSVFDCLVTLGDLGYLRFS